MYTVELINNIPETEHIKLHDEYIVQFSLLHPVEKDALAIVFKLYPEDIELGLNTVTLKSGKTLYQTISPLLTTSDELLSKVLSDKDSSYVIKTIAPSMIPTEIVLSPKFNQSQISVTLLDENNQPMMNGQGDIKITGKTPLNGYFTQLQNGVFSATEPDHICHVDVNLSTIRIWSEDLSETVVSYQVIVRQFNE